MEQINKYWDRIHLQYQSSYDEWLNKYVYLFNENDRIIELGCGRAYCSKYLLDNGFLNIMACDISGEVLKIVHDTIPNLKTLQFDMSDGLPFDDNSVNIIIADLCLHYFDATTTVFLLDEIHRVLIDNGLLIGRVNATNDSLHIPPNASEIEENYYFDGNIYKRFFESKDFETLFSEFEIEYLELKEMNRYERPKMLWEFCIKDVKEKRKDRSK